MAIPESTNEKSNSIPSLLYFKLELWRLIFGFFSSQFELASLAEGVFDGLGSLPHPPDESLSLLPQPLDADESLLPQPLLSAPGFFDSPPHDSPLLASNATFAFLTSNAWPSIKGLISSRLFQIGL